MEKTSKKISSERWKIAQDSEKEFWKEFNPDIVNELGRYHSEKAEVLTKDFEKFILINEKTKILQVGCAAIDVINYMGGDTYSIDPLADFYKKRFKIDYKKTKFVKGVAESLPYTDKYFDIVIYDNVLDHVYWPEKTMQEIKRVLKDEGTVFFACHFYQESFIHLSRIYDLTRKFFGKGIFNIHHPYMFNLHNLKKVISTDFEILNADIGKEIGIFENFQDLKEKKCSDKNARIRIPAKFGLFGIINYSCFLKKKKYAINFLF